MKSVNKRGFTISVVSATVTIMIILVATVITVGVNSVNAANFEEYMSLMYRMNATIYDYIMFNNAYPTTGEVLKSSDFKSELNSKVIANGDVDADFYVIDVSKVIENTNYGKGTVENEDVFIVSSKTYRVYYLAGKNHNGVTYYTVN